MTMADPPPSGPAGPPDVPRADQIVLLLCSDVSDTGPCPVPVAEIAAAVRGRVPCARVLAVANPCSGATGLPAALQALGARRVTVGCRHAATRREEITARLRKAGIHLAGIGVADLMPAGQPDRLRVIGQSAARLHAAVARIGNADLDTPAGEQPAAATGPLSRRNLFHPGTIAHRPVVHRAAGRCPSGEGCRACASACPHGAIRVTGSGVTVDPAACTGCGACLPACPAGAMSLSGLPIRAFEAAAGVLVAEAQRPGPGRVHGVAIVCERAAAQVPVGADWLPLEVPSLEMTSAGWLLQILSAGAGVAIVGCDDDACARHRRELDSLCAALADEAAPGWQRLTGQFTGWDSPAPSRSERRAAGRAAPIGLREPAATAGALSALFSRAQPATGTPGTAAAPTSPAPGTGQGRRWRPATTAAPRMPAEDGAGGGRGGIRGM